MFIIREIIVNIEHEDYVSNNLFMSIRHMNKNREIPGLPLLLFLCTEQFTYTSLFTLFAGQGSSLIVNMQNVNLLLHLFASLCPHTVF